MNYISFSVYGTEIKYLNGAVINCRNILLNYPAWQPIFYCSAEANLAVGGVIDGLGGIVQTFENDWHKNGMFWRFFALNINQAERVLFRDTDSRVDDREMNLVEDWVKSKKVLHIIRDHPNHKAEILGGLWGIRANSIDCKDILKNTYKYGDNYGDDQQFLLDEVYTKYKKHAYVNDDFYFINLKKKQTGARKNGGYIGESFDENGNFDPVLREKITRLERYKFLKLLYSTKYLLIQVFWLFKKRVKSSS